MHIWSPHNRKHVAAGVALACVLFAGIAVSAWARTGNGSFNVQNANVEFDGYVKWNPRGTGHGGMVVNGNLYDRMANGKWVYFSALVSGYGYNRLKENHNGAGTAAYLTATEVYDPQATYVDNGRVKACQSDNFGDTCTEEYMYR